MTSRWLPFVPCTWYSGSSTASSVSKVKIVECFRTAFRPDGIHFRCGESESCPDANRCPGAGGNADPAEDDRSHPSSCRLPLLQGHHVPHRLHLRIDHRLPDLPAGEAAAELRERRWVRRCETWPTRTLTSPFSSRRGGRLRRHSLRTDHDAGSVRGTFHDWLPHGTLRRRRGGRHRRAVQSDNERLDDDRNSLVRRPIVCHPQPVLAERSANSQNESIRRSHWR